MRYPVAEKQEIIGLVEQSALSVRRTLAQIGIPRSTFYVWYQRYREHSIEASRIAGQRPGGSGISFRRPSLRRLSI